MLDIVDANKELLTKKDYYHPYIFNKDNSVLIVERCFFKNHDSVMNNVPYFYIKEDDIYLDVFHNVYGLIHDKEYSIKVQGYYQGFIINGNEAKVELVGDNSSPIREFFITQYRDYTFKYNVLSFEEVAFEVDQKKINCIFAIEMRQNDKLLHRILLIQDFYHGVYVKQIDDIEVRYEDKDILMPLNKDLFTYMEPFIEIKEKEDIYLNEDNISKEIWNGSNQVKSLNIHISNNVKSLGENIIRDYNHTNITIYYEGTYKEWLKIKKGKFETSINREWVDYQHNKYYDVKTTTYVNFINSNSEVKIICKDLTIKDNTEINKNNPNE